MCAMQTPDLAGPAVRFPDAEYVGRLRRLAARLRATKLDGALIHGPVARLYYTGFEATNGILVVDPRRGPTFYTDSRYLTMARRQLPFLPCQLLRRGEHEAAQLERMTPGWQRIGYEGSIAATRLHALQGHLPRCRDWVDLDDLLRAQRAIKTPREQAAIRRAVAANDRLLAAVLAQVRVGMSEWSIRNLVRREADRLGQGESFDTIACVGANAAEPHHHPDHTLLGANQSLLLDLGLKLDHYCADLTRTVCFGRPSALFREVHAQVLAANRLAVEQVRPGMTGAEVDAIARGYLDRAGYGKAFGHGLGHALGLEVHEWPSVAPGGTAPLRPGMVVTIEPGVYLPGRVGVRIEDVVLVTECGCEVLSAAPREWAVQR